MCIAGTIPSQLCSSTGLSMNVYNTQITCYAGCLTSANIIIHGASAVCPDGSILRLFLIIVGTCTFIGIMSTILYTYALSVYSRNTSITGMIRYGDSIYVDVSILRLLYS